MAAPRRTLIAQPPLPSAAGLDRPPAGEGELLDRRIGLQTRQGKDRAGAPVLGRPSMLLLDCADGMEWSSHPRVCFPAPLRGKKPDPGAYDHRAGQGRSVSGRRWCCPLVRRSPSARCGGMVLPWGGPAPALARGASSGRSEDRFYAWWRDALWREASWRELCSVKPSPHEGERSSRPVCRHPMGSSCKRAGIQLRYPDPDAGFPHHFTTEGCSGVAISVPVLAGACRSRRSCKDAAETGTPEKQQGRQMHSQSVSPGGRRTGLGHGIASWSRADDLVGMEPGQGKARDKQREGCRHHRETHGQPIMGPLRTPCSSGNGSNTAGRNDDEQSHPGTTGISVCRTVGAKCQADQTQRGDDDDQQVRLKSAGGCFHAPIVATTSQPWAAQGAVLLRQEGSNILQEPRAASNLVQTLVIYVDDKAGMVLEAQRF